MRLETLPLLLGIVVAIAALALLIDAYTPDTPQRRERRRRQRPERHRHGEAAMGVGLLLVAAALIGRDTWRYTSLAILLALFVFAAGLALNYKYVRGLMFGPAIGPTSSRRSTDVQPAPAPEKPTSEDEKLRIR